MEAFERQQEKHIRVRESENVSFTQRHFNMYVSHLVTQPHTEQWKRQLLLVSHLAAADTTLARSDNSTNTSAPFSLGLPASPPNKDRSSKMSFLARLSKNYLANYLG